MKQQESTFKFEGYKIIKSHLEFSGDETSKDINIVIKPSGEKGAEIFTLKLDVEIRDEKESLKIDLIVVSTFKFNNISESALGQYFLINAPAIVFPYIRAYISTLSTLSGLKTITLPTLNMISLGKELSQNIN